MYSTVARCMRENISNKGRRNISVDSSVLCVKNVVYLVTWRRFMEQYCALIVEVLQF
jgi:hypothetical protein